MSCGEQVPSVETEIHPLACRHACSNQKYLTGRVKCKLGYSDSKSRNPFLLSYIS